MKTFHVRITTKDGKCFYTTVEAVTATAAAKLFGDWFFDADSIIGDYDDEFQLVKIGEPYRNNELIPITHWVSEQSGGVTNWRYAEVPVTRALVKI